MYKFIGIISHEDVGKHIAKDVVTLPLPKPHVGFISSFGNIHVVNDGTPDHQVFTKELSHTLNQPLLYLEYLIWGGLFVAIPRFISPQNNHNGNASRNKST